MENCKKIISVKNARHNLKVLEYVTEKKVSFVAKSYAYGHGLEAMIKALDGECDFFCLFTLKESLDARKITNTKILNVGDHGNALIASKNNIAIKADSLERLQKIKEELNGEKVEVHIKINSGMNRFGIKTKNELLKIIDFLKQNTNIAPKGIYTHLPFCSNEEATQKQIDKFKEFAEIAKKHFNLCVHIGGSGAKDYDISFADYFRCGGAIYGYAGDMQTKSKNQYKKQKKLRIAEKIKEKHAFLQKKQHFLLKFVKNLKFFAHIKLTLLPVMRIEADVISIQELKVGDHIGYEDFYTAEKNITAATLPVGYCDGFCTRLRDKLQVKWNGQKLNAIGKMCMDVIMIDITNKGVKLGDTIVLFDNANEWGEILGYRTGEVLTLFSSARADTIFEY